MSFVQLLSDAKLALLNAPFDENGWAAAIDQLAGACGASGANLVGFGGPAGFGINLFTGRDQARSTEYFARPELWGACNWRVNSAGAGAMSIQHDGHYAAYRAIADTADYDDAVSDLDMQFGCQSALIQDSRSFLGLALFRGPREGPCDSVMIERFTILIRDVHRALRVQLALAGEAAELMLGQLSAMTVPMLLLDGYGCLAALTPAAEPLVEENGPFRLCGLTVQLREPRENRWLQAEMARMLALGRSGDGRRLFEMPVGRSAAAPGGRWIASVVRLPQREHGLGFDPHLALTVRPLA